ncbi:MAG: Gfo/Idh/MocA family oxidoreductase, partial [Flavobacteriaceae bacterium]|nr:Gfo/Idh/MocA family oxidoreductase [Flavobacteriaceae bacterium]
MLKIKTFPMSNIKIALIGAGYIADFHARGLQTIPGVEITAVLALDLKEAQDFAAKYDIKNA